jgi:pyruvate,water dikinase
MGTHFEWIQDIDPQVGEVGGKAAGLRKLIGWGLAIPTGFVIIDARKTLDTASLARHYRAMGGGKVAVRSSALGEDGNDHSFAGLYESVLDVEGEDKLAEAVLQCVDSLNSQRAREYRHQHDAHECSMSVVVQRMVDAEAAGVLFSVDPVSGRHDRLVIDAVPGLGEALVSGDQTPDHYEYDLDNMLCYQELVGDVAILTAEQRLLLVQEARQAVVAANEPLDMEWAFNKEGELFWLQARPVTTVGSDLNELDTPINPGDVLTRCNIGEMMPGASCPLTFSTTGRAIEHGMQHMHVSYAGRAAITDTWTQVAMCSGKMFLNMTGSAAAGSTVLGIDVKSMGLSLCGRIVDELKPPPKRAIFVRLFGMLKMLWYLHRADAVIDEFKQRAKAFHIPVKGSSAELAKALDESKAFFYEAFAVHLQSSTTSGFASNVLQAMISGGQESSPEEEAEAGRLMAGARDVESAVLVDQLDEIVEEISRHHDAQACFVDTTPRVALAWLRGNGSPVGHKFADFLDRHGHRAYRELCVREVCWSDAPETLVATMQASVAARLTRPLSSVRPDVADVSGLSRGLRWIVPKAHNAVRRREATKSLLVDITNRLKRGYRALGNQLVAENKLDDADLVFFFLHDELMAFVRNTSSHEFNRYWNQHTKMRRRALDFQNRLEFEEICVGAPQPIDVRNRSLDIEGQLVGRPVSRGIVEARARVAFSVTEAAAIQPGEILVAPITDVGWTPYFSMIAGLVTDVGSAVSHGAVIAREYGLPAIVNTRYGTKQIKTGDMIRLNADTGVVTIL